MKCAFILCLLTASAVAQEFEYGIGQTEQVTKGLIGYWAMRNSGTNTFDEFGNLPAYSVGNCVFSYADGLVGTGVKLSGSNGLIKTTATAFPSGSFSVFGWVKCATTNDEGVISKYEGNAEHRVFYLYISGVLQARINHNGTATPRTDISGITRIPLNAWVFVGMVVDCQATNVTLYVNGNADKTAAMTSPVVYNFTDVFVMGAIGPIATGNYINGNLDEVRVYNRAITAAEIKQLYRMGALPRGLK